MKIRHELKEGKIIHVREGDGIAQQQKINSPTLAYMTVYGEEPEEFLRGRTDAPKKMWHGLDVDEDLKDEWLEALNGVKGIEIRSSDAGKSKERIAFVVLRFADEENDNKAKALVEKLKQVDDVYSATDIGMAGRPRICVAGKIWKGQNGWERWWENLAEEIEKAVEETLQEGFAAEIFTPQDYEPDKLRELSDEELWAKHKELIAFFRQRGSKRSDELVKNAYRFIKEEVERRGLKIEFDQELLAACKEGSLDGFLISRAKKIHELGQIIWRPNFASVTGSAAFVENRLPNDLDAVFRTNEVDDGLLLKVDRIFEKYFGSPSHPIPGPYGPNWRHLPIWDLALVPTKELKFVDINEPGFIKNFYEALSLPAAVPRAGSKEIRKQAADSIKEDKIELGRFFLGQKPTRPAFPEERMTIDSLLKYFKPEDFPVRVEKKYDGARHAAHVDGKKVEIFSDDGEDNTGRLPQTVVALKKLSLKKGVYDTEIEAWEGKKHLPREVVAGYLHSHREPDDSHLVSNIFGLLYDGEDLHKKTEDERRAALEKIKFPQSTINEPDLRYRLNLVPSKIAKDITELRKIIEDLRWRPASEGVVVKKCAGRYYLDRNSRDNWFKLHNTAVLAGIVAEVIETKVKGVYNYRYAIDQEEHDVKPGDLVEVKDREWLEVGKTFSTEKKVNRGDIIEIEFETLNFISDARTRTVKVTAWVPRFMKVLPERSTPSVLSDVVERAKKNHILRRKVITEAGRTLYASLGETEVEYLNLEEYKQFVKEHYGVSFGETAQILATETFLESLVPDEITENEITEIARTNLGFAAALRKATAKAKKRPRFWAVIVNHFRKRSQHKDFRNKMNGYLEGDTIADLPEGAITEDIETIKDGRYWQEKVEFKFRPDMDPATHCVVIPKAKEPMVWLEFDDVGMGKHAAVPPGGVGATKFGWGVFIREDAGMAYPTCKKPYFKEWFLDMKTYKGRMVIRLIPVGKEWKKPPKKKLQWQGWFNLKDQTPYILSRRARLKKDYIPDGVHTTASGLPPDWEKKIPIAMRWWVGKLSRKEKLDKMDEAYNYLVGKGELKGRPLKETPEPKIASFIVRRRWWKGPKIIRDIPKQHWDLVIDSGKEYLDEWNLEHDPLIEKNLEDGIAAFRKKCTIRTPKGRSFRKWMEFEGTIPPKHAEWGNPNKRIPAYIKILDRGKVNWIEDTELFSSFEFKGKILKGNVVSIREEPGAAIWVMRKASLPGQPRKESHELL